VPAGRIWAVAVAAHDQLVQVPVVAGAWVAAVVVAVAAAADPAKKP